MKQAVNQINFFLLDMQFDLQKLPTMAHSILSSSLHLSLLPPKSPLVFLLSSLASSEEPSFDPLCSLQFNQNLSSARYIKL